MHVYNDDIDTKVFIMVVKILSSSSDILPLHLSPFRLDILPTMLRSLFALVCDEIRHWLLLYELLLCRQSIMLVNVTSRHKPIVSKQFSRNEAPRSRTALLHIL